MKKDSTQSLLPVFGPIALPAVTAAALQIKRRGRIEPLVRDDVPPGSGTKPEQDKRKLIDRLGRSD